MKYTNFLLCSFCLVLLLSTQCADNDPAVSQCSSNVRIDNLAYKNANSAYYNLINTEIYSDCLTIHISASGCSGESWILELIDSDSVTESFPPQRHLKFALTNSEACLAVFSKSESFDLASLRLDGINEVILNIEDFSDTIIYSY